MPDTYTSEFDDEEDEEYCSKCGELLDYCDCAELAQDSSCPPSAKSEACPDCDELAEDCICEKNANTYEGGKIQGRRDAEMSLEPKYFVGDDSGADSEGHAEFMRGYVKGYTDETNK